MAGIDNPGHRFENESERGNYSNDFDARIGNNNNPGRENVGASSDLGEGDVQIRNKVTAGSFFHPTGQRSSEL